MISDETRRQSLKLIESGAPEDVALRSLGVLGAELQTALSDPAFKAEIEVATARFEVSALWLIRDGSISQKRNMSWLLSARIPERYPAPGSRSGSPPAPPVKESPAPEPGSAVERMLARREQRLRELEDAKLEEGMTAVERMEFRRARRRQALEERRALDQAQGGE